MSCCRRDFLKTSLGCGAYTSLFLAGLSSFDRNAFAKPQTKQVVHTEPFARIEKISDGIWAIISTPQNGPQTMSNGGIIAGKDGVLLIEGFVSAEGAAWQHRMAKELTGKNPTHAVITHYHFDHSNGLSGYMNQGKGPKIIATQTTRNELISFHKNNIGELEEGESAIHLENKILLPDMIIPDGAKSFTLDLGGKVVEFTCRHGHTKSDLTIELIDPAITFCGDLFFNRMFPYYGDATPSILGTTCQSLLNDTNKTIVPGHGPIANKDDIKKYLGLLGHVEEAARKAIKKELSPEQAWQEFSIPKSLGEWSLFRPDVSKFAFMAWEKELKN